MTNRVLALVGSLVLAASVAAVSTSTRHASAADLHPAAVQTATPPDQWSTLPAERTFPTGTNMVNVKDHGVYGDGMHDDTTAIQALITANIHKLDGSPRILYFPSGTYLVSNTLYWRDSAGFSAELTFQGENEGNTVIKLTSQNSQFSNDNAPKPVIETASLMARDDGGGNDGFDNFIYDMTVDVGSNNPGATAIDFIGNNYCGLRNVTLKSTDANRRGAVGLNMTRYATGPCLMKNLFIDGFDYGIKSANSEYSVTFENLAVEHQNKAGISNTDNVLSIHDLTSVNAVPAVQNLGSAAAPNRTGLVTLVTANLSNGSPGVSAIQNTQTLYARDITAGGYRSAIQDPSGNPVPGLVVASYDSETPYTLFGGGGDSLDLPIASTPEFQETDVSKWVSVVAKGADPTGATDSSSAVQAAIDSGTMTVYFPTGKYLIQKPIVIRGNVRKIEGFDSNLRPTGGAFGGTTVNPLFLFENTVPVIVDHIRFGDPNLPFPGVRYLEDESSEAVTIEDSVFDRMNFDSVYKNGADGTGPLFLENICGAYWEILHPQNVYARQFNNEGDGRKVVNDGGTLWILGYKTEKAGDSTHTAALIDTEQSGQTEVLGGLVYAVEQYIPVDQAAFVVNNSRASFIYAVSVHNPISSDPGTPDGDFKIQVQEVQAGVVRNLTTATVRAMTPRGEGVMMPLYTSQP